MGRSFRGYDEYGTPIYVDFEAVDIDVETEGLYPEEKHLISEVETVTTELCRHCGTPIRMTPSGWVHHGGRLNCLSSSIAITFAQPTLWEVAE